MKALVLFIIIISSPLFSDGQVQAVLPVSTAENGSLTAVAYDWQAIGVNPANLGWDVNHKFSFTILDIGLGGQSTGMIFPVLMTALESNSLISRSNSWQRIMGVPSGMDVNADINWFAFSFRLPAIRGAFAIDMRDRVTGNGFLDVNASQALIHSNDGEYNDATIMSFLNGTRLNYLHYREINVDYGVGFNDNSGVGSGIDQCFSFTGSTDKGNILGNIYLGVGFKYIFGVADINGGVTNGGLDAIYDMNNRYPNIPADFFNTPGHGYAFDVGVSTIFNRWKFGVSITNVGSITWSHGSAVNGDTNVTPIKNGDDFIRELKTGTLAGSEPQPSYSTSLPSDLRFGASYKANKKLVLSSDLIFPLSRIPGGLTGPYFALGAQWNATKVVTFSTGIATAKGFGWGIPLGATFNANKHIQFYVGVTDITSYFGKQDASVSLATWVFSYSI